jgi:hypothetical protein
VIPWLGHLATLSPKTAGKSAAWIAVVAPGLRITSTTRQQVNPARLSFTHWRFVLLRGPIRDWFDQQSNLPDYESVAAAKAGSINYRSRRNHNHQIRSLHHYYSAL